MSTDKSFLGTGWSFPLQFSPASKSPRMVSADEDIQQALCILFGTTPGERVMHPTYGCDLRRMVFETINTAAITEIKDIVEQAVLFHEPRITLESVDVQVVDEIAGELRIELEYTVRTINTRSNMVYPFYLLEGTNLRVDSGG
jgi:phage baseplate assembly protein W